jgi:hypothetical protein
MRAGSARPRSLGPRRFRPRKMDIVGLLGAREGCHRTGFPQVVLHWNLEQEEVHTRGTGSTYITAGNHSLRWQRPLFKMHSSRHFAGST